MSHTNSTTFPPETEISILALTPFDGQVLRAAYQCETVVSFVRYIADLSSSGKIHGLTTACKQALEYYLEELIAAGGAE